MELQKLKDKMEFYISSYLGVGYGAAVLDS